MRFKNFLKEGNPLSRLHTHIADNRGSVVISPERNGMQPHERAAAHEKMKGVLKTHGYGYRQTHGLYDEGNGVMGGEGSYHVFAKDNTMAAQADLHKHAEGWSKDFGQQSYMRVHSDGEGGARGVGHFTQDVPDRGIKAGDLEDWGKIRYNVDNQDYGETHYQPSRPISGRQKFAATDKPVPKAEPTGPKFKW